MVSVVQIGGTEVMMDQYKMSVQSSYSVVSSQLSPLCVAGSCVPIHCNFQTAASQCLYRGRWERAVVIWLSSLLAGSKGVVVPSWLQSWCWETSWVHRNLHTEKLGAPDPIHCGVTYMQWRVVSQHPPEIYNPSFVLSTCGCCQFTSSPAGCITHKLTESRQLNANI